ncbi:MAG: hypothetical protein K5917_03295, partial [Clostridiales bacterium]|nr:hypothetical protein [Clostridiales bacterium]
ELPDFPVDFLIDKLTTHIDIRFAGKTRFFVPEEQNEISVPFFVWEDKHEHSYLNEEYHKGINY